MFCRCLQLQVLATKFQNLIDLCRRGFEAFMLDSTTMCDWLSKSIYTSLHHTAGAGSAASYGVEHFPSYSSSSNESMQAVAYFQFKQAAEAVSSAGVKNKTPATASSATSGAPKKAKGPSGAAVSSTAQAQAAKKWRDGTVSQGGAPPVINIPHTTDPGVGTSRAERTSWYKCAAFRTSAGCPKGDSCPRLHVGGKCYFQGKPYVDCLHNCDTQGC